jgi:hypothetical protein
MLTVACGVVLGLLFYHHGLKIMKVMLSIGLIIGLVSGFVWFNYVAVQWFAGIIGW